MFHNFTMMKFALFCALEFYLKFSIPSKENQATAQLTLNTDLFGVEGKLKSNLYFRFLRVGNLTDSNSTMT